MSTYTVVTNFKKQSGFLGPPCRCTAIGCLVMSVKFASNINRLVPMRIITCWVNRSIVRRATDALRLSRLVTFSHVHYTRDSCVDPSVASRRRIDDERTVDIRCWQRRRYWSVKNDWYVYSCRSALTTSAV